MTLDPAAEGDICVSTQDQMRPRVAALQGRHHALVGPTLANHDEAGNQAPQVRRGGTVWKVSPMHYRSLG